MKKWVSVFYWLGVLSIILAIPCLLFIPAAAIGLIVSAVSCFFMTSVCSAVQTHLAMQKRMIENQSKILSELDSIARRMQ